MLMSSWLFVCAEIPIRLPEADNWCSVHMPRLWTAKEMRENAHLPFKTLLCAGSIFRQQTVQHKRIIE